MNKFALLISFVFAAGVAVAQDAPKSEDVKAPAPAQAESKATDATHTHAAKAAVKTHKVEGAEIVSTDAAAKTITIKSESGENKTVPAEGKAITEMKSVKPGEMWTLTCRDNEKGEHQAVIAMTKTPAVKKTSTTTEKK